MIMSCSEVQRFLQAYLDLEIDGEDRILIAAHLQSCEACKEVVQFERAFKQKLRESIGPDQEAPPWLRQKVQRALAASDPSAEPMAFKWLRVLIPATVAALMLIGVLVSKPLEAPQAAVLADQSIDWHRRHLPMDVTGPSPDTVRRFFSDKVPFAVRPPVFRQPGTRLVGARLANIFQHQAAYVVYRVGNRRVSVFIFDSDALHPEGSLTRVGDRRVLWHRRRGYNVAMYNSHGTAYMVASDLERKQLVNLIAHSE